MDIADKIRKLLSLSKSPVESEAKLALTKARELMAKYKINESEVREQESELIWYKLQQTYTTLRDAWLGEVAKVIGTSFGCGVVLSTEPRKKTRYVTLVGTQSDVNAVLEAISYAVSYIRTKEAEYATQVEDDGDIVIRPRKQVRDYITSYGLGFGCGLQKAFNEQNAISEETGLVLTVSQEVKDAINEKYLFKKCTGISVYNQEAYASGVEDGKNFNYATKKIG